MIWAQWTVNEFDFDEIAPLLGRTMIVTVDSEGYTHEQIGKIVSAERRVSARGTYVAVLFKHAGYIFAEGPLSLITFATTAEDDKHVAEMKSLLEDFRNDMEDPPPPERWRDRTLRSLFGGGGS